MSALVACLAGGWRLPGLVLFWMGACRGWCLRHLTEQKLPGVGGVGAWEGFGVDFWLIGKKVVNLHFISVVTSDNYSYNQYERGF